MSILTHNDLRVAKKLCEKFANTLTSFCLMRHLSLLSIQFHQKSQWSDTNKGIISQKDT